MSEEFSFCDLRELFAKANEEKSGDQLAGDQSAGVVQLLVDLYHRRAR